MSSTDTDGCTRPKSPILGAYFSDVVSLEVYLQAALNDNGACIRAVTLAESEQLDALLRTSSVGLNTPLIDYSNYFVSATPMVHMQEVSG